MTTECAVIDFGTTNTGVAVIDKTGYVHICNQYEGTTEKCIKIPTVLAYEINNISTPIAFGPAAIEMDDRQFQQDGPSTGTVVDKEFRTKQQCEIALFRYFKMGVFKPNELWRDTRNLVSKRVEDLISDYLKLFWTSVKETMKITEKHKICLTVPAIYTEAEKDLMKKAAIKAGMVPPNPTDDQFMICLEPEAGAVDCMRNVNGKEGVKMKSGDKLLTVDLGGGTNDCTCCELLSAEQMKEIVPGAGNAFGSTVIDKNFVAQLKEIFSSSFIDEMQSSCPAGWTQFMKNIEKRKCEMKTLDETARIQVPPTLLQKFTQIVKTMPNGNDYFDSDLKVVKIPKLRVHKIFDPVFDEIVELVRKFVDAVKLDYIFVVGGGAESKPLQKHLRDTFATSTTHGIDGIIIPAGPQGSIIRGGVLLGSRENFIKSRQLRYSYGIALAYPYSADVHSSDKFTKKVFSGAVWVTDIFKTFVQRGDDVEYDKVVDYTVHPMYAEQSEAEIKLFSSDVYVPPNTTTASGKHMCTLKIGLGGYGTDRQIIVKMHFGRAQLKLEAVDVTTGKQSQTSCVYMQ